MSTYDYWREAVEIGLEEIDVRLTPDQVESLSRSVEHSHEMYGMATGRDCIPNPMVTEINEQKRLHKAEVEITDRQHSEAIKELRDENCRLRCRLQDMGRELQEAKRNVR